MPFSDTTHTLYDCTLRATTMKAVKVTTASGIDLWIPYSVIHECPSDLREEGDVIVDEWWYDRKVSEGTL